MLPGLHPTEIKVEEAERNLYTPPPLLDLYCLLLAQQNNVHDQELASTTCCWTTEAQSLFTCSGSSSGSLAGDAEWSRSKFLSD